MARSPQERAWPGAVHNMSAPPRSTVCFRPYGAGDRAASSQASIGSGGGLRWMLRVQPDALLEACLPEVHGRMAELRAQALACGQAKQREQAALAVSRVRLLRLAGLTTLAGRLAGASDMPPPDMLARAPLETLLDRLADLATRLPVPESLPALALAERPGGKYPIRATSTEPAATLWVLTHLNGRTFDRDSLPLLAPDLAEGGAWDLYAP